MPVDEKTVLKENIREPGRVKTLLGRPGGRERLAHGLILAAILALAVGLRFWHLGRLSLWYDEVVPMRLAQQPGPAALVRLLNQIEATRAPLHPLVLQGWLRLFGTSDAAGRSLSAACGVLTVLVVYGIARSLHDPATALWSAGLASWSPLLVLYAQEAKMYSWLLFLTCVSWALLLSMRRRASLAHQAAYGASLIALAYSHPLSVFMFAAQAAAYLTNLRGYALPVGRWLLIQVVVVLAVIPWAGHYVDHPPEIVSARPTLKLLAGLPIGFVGGDRRTLILFAIVVAVGILCLDLNAVQQGEEGTPPSSRSGPMRLRIDNPFAVTTLGIWFLVPPLLLFSYSFVSYPLFGQARYTLYVGPAFLILLGHGMAKLPRVLSALLGVLFVWLAVNLLITSVYAPDRKADWRAAWQLLSSPMLAQLRPESVFVVTEDPTNTAETETARYYLGQRFRVLPFSVARIVGNDTSNQFGKRVVFAIPLRSGSPVVALPAWVEQDYRTSSFLDVPGLRLMWAEPKPRPPN
jgi:4-amino-4-deoxy-L-arabinose transferase-like glycosyltransferase